MSGPQPIEVGAAKNAATGALFAICSAWLALIWLWEPGYLTLAVDDSFYYLQTARNLAAGHGSTFDQLNPTNGYHPLWLLVLAGLSWIADCGPATLMRLALSLQVLLVATGALTLAPLRAAGGHRVPAVLAVLLCNFYVAKTVINGQESALLFLLLCATLRQLWSLQTARTSAPRSLLLGALLGLCVLARIDAALFATGAATLFALSQLRRSGLRGASRPALAVVTAAALVAPYLWWGQSQFSHWLPVSASLKLGGRSMWGMAIAAATLATATAILWQLAGRGAGRDWRQLIVFAFPLAVHAVLHAGLTAGPQPPWVVQIWYLAPATLLATIAVAGTLARAGRSTRVRAGVAALVGWLLLGGYTWQQRLRPESYSPPLAKRAMARWLATHTPDRAIVAGWNVGVLGSHAERRTINLDGLINSYRYRDQFLLSGRTASFINDVHRVDYIADYQRLRVLQDTWSRPGVAQFRQLDLRGWYVAYLDMKVFIPAGRGERALSDVYLILSRERCAACSLRFEELAARERRSRSAQRP